MFAAVAVGFSAALERLDRLRVWLLMLRRKRRLDAPSMRRQVFDVNDATMCRPRVRDVLPS
jgi:hypothetical protein